MKGLQSVAGLSVRMQRVATKFSSSLNSFPKNGIPVSGSSFFPSRIVISCWKENARFVSKAPNVKYNHQFQRGFRRSTKSEFDSARSNEPKTQNMNFGNSVLKPIVFTAFVGVTSVTACTIWQYELYRSALIKDNKSLSQLLRLSSPPFGEKRGELRQQINTWWRNISQGEQIFWPICALNVMVYLAWRIPALSPTMVKWFSTNPSSRAIALPMLLSTFSHFSLYHLAANMFVLHSFAPAAAQILGREQFLAMYLTSGVVASLGSHLHKLYIGSIVPSLGASGAIMGVIGLVCSNMPEIQLGIIFIPGINFSADTALKCILAIDSFGLLAGWRFLDHAAHLSGCLFGIAFNYFGAVPLNAFRDTVTKAWHNFRTRGSGSGGGPPSSVR
jgi:rhomboid-like protein